MAPEATGVAFRGALALLIASLCAGVGNAVTGLTAHDYISSGSLLPAVDIGLANTLGGLALVSIFYFVLIFGFKNRGTLSGSQETKTTLTHFRSGYSLMAGFFKGTNTVLFVVSTTYIVATQSLVFESTYLIWSLILGVSFLARRMTLVSSLLKTLLMLAGVILVSGETSFNLTIGYSTLGATFGILAGVSFALYLFSWSFVTKSLENTSSSLLATGLLLSISAITIVVFSEILTLVFLGVPWVPFASLKPADSFLQILNGGLNIGIVYLLVASGMSAMRNVREGADFVASILLSFTIPFTLLTELVIGKFVPSDLQLLGVLVFMVGFILIGKGLSPTYSSGSQS